MGIERTDEWMEKHQFDPIQVCEELLSYFEGGSKKQLFQYLKWFGLYHSINHGEQLYKKLIQDDVWKKVKKLYQFYKKKWNGPSIPIFIFPYQKANTFMRTHNKSGLAFPDKLLLFLSADLGNDDVEALFIHEYHHVCRLQKQKKEETESTVADTIILEGLAEYTVRTIMGEENLAPWIKKYSNTFLESFWTTKFKDQLSIQKKDRLHDSVIYGRGSFPTMVGYCLGYHIVEFYFQTYPFSEKTSFSISSEEIIDHYDQKKIE